MEIGTSRVDPLQFGAIDHNQSGHEGQIMKKDEIKDFLFMVSGAGMPGDDNSGTFDSKA